MIASNDGLPIIIQEGVHHPYELFVSTGSSNNVPDFRLTVYPNPTDGLVNIQSENLKGLQIEVSDQFGKTLFKKNLNDKDDEIDLRDYSGAVYFLKSFTPIH